jgi:ABC-type sulfate transport system substrate-binding protein
MRQFVIASKPDPAEWLVTWHVSSTRTTTQRSSPITWLRQDVKIDQSHAGSSAVARSVTDGLDADVVTMVPRPVSSFLTNAGVVAKDWANLPGNASPTTSTMLFLVSATATRASGLLGRP